MSIRRKIGAQTSQGTSKSQLIRIDKRLLGVWAVHSVGIQIETKSKVESCGPGVRPQTELTRSNHSNHYLQPTLCLQNRVHNLPDYQKAHPWQDGGFRQQATLSSVMPDAIYSEAPARVRLFRSPMYQLFFRCSLLFFRASPKVLVSGMLSVTRRDTRWG
jgi:hypothetical protein